MKKGETFFGGITFYAALISPAFLFIIFLVVYNRNKELQGNLTLMKSRKATKVARKRLSQAKMCLEKNEREKFYDEIFKALWGYLSDKLAIPVSALSKETVHDALKSKGIREEEISQFISTIDSCEFARFAPGGEGEMKTMYSETIELISKMEGGLR